MGKYVGVYRGIVEDNKDPKKQGRLKIRVPGLHGKNGKIPWAYPAMPFGIYPPYPKGSIVWVMFQNGDAQYPVFMGYSLMDKGDSWGGGSCPTV